MASVINTNINSLNTQRNINASQGSLATSMQRLSSGMRINSGKDDASGLAIATKMDSQVRGMNVAIRNSNDAISFAQTADGGLSKINDALQRMRELAVQGANGTTDNASLKAEFSELQKEITRVSSNTMFNGTNTLGSAAATGLTFQVGAGTSSNDSVTVKGVDLSTGVAGVSAAQVAAGTAAVSAAATATTAAATATTNAGALPTATAVETAAKNAAVAAAAAQTAAALAQTTAAGLLPTAAVTASGSAVAGATSASIQVDNAANSIGAIDQIDLAITEVNNSRATFGAVQNRFEAIVSNLQVSAENQSAAKSRIMDTDFAAETANLSRANILQQAGTAMLAQANSSPNGVLALLRG